MERIVIEIEKAQKDAFKKKAESEGHTMAFVVRQLVEVFLNQPAKGGLMVSPHFAKKRWGEYEQDRDDV